MFNIQVGIVMKTHTNDLIETAEKLFKDDRFYDIIINLTDKVLERGKCAKLYAWKAIANFKLNYDDTVTMLLAKKAIETDSNYFMGYFARACAWQVKNEYNEAIADYDIAIHLNPDYAVAYYYRGLVWQNKKEKEKAIADFDAAINCGNYTH